MPAILCPRCHKLIDSTAAACPFCGLRRPGMLGLTSVLRRLSAQVDVPRWIVYFCSALYAASLLSDPRAIFQPHGMMGLLAPSMKASLRFGATGAFPVLGYGHWWTVVTAIYLHGGLLHIFFNMMWVRQLGPLVEEMFGGFRLFVIFTVAGICGFVLSVVMGHGLTLGASGSIFGLLAAAIEFGRRSGAQLFTRQFLQWAVVLFIFGLVFPGVDNWAHAGGFAGGYAAAYAMGRAGRGEGLGAYAAAGGCLVVTAGAFLLQAAAVLGG